VVDKSYFSLSANFNQAITLPRNYAVEISGWVYSYSFNGTVRAGGTGAVNAGIRKDLNKNRGRLQLAVNDILQTIRYGANYGTITREAFDISNDVAYYPETRFFPVFKLTYSRSFGGDGVNQKSAQKRSQEELNRLP
jgi:hypothetical protein